MSVSPPPTYDAHYTTTTGLKPYLELPYLYSLSWLAYPILSLIFVAFRLTASLSSSQDAIDSAKSNLLASCKAAETAATSAASMPRYMAVVMNQQYADAVNGSLNAARATLVLSLTIMEAIINFIVDIYRSTLLCFVELVVRGGLAILIAGVAELNKVVTAAADGISDAIDGSISAANSAISGAIDAINKVNPFSDITVPTIDKPDLSALSNVTLPDSFTSALTSLNNSLPTFNEIKDKIEQVIDTPFELLKGEINDTFAGLNMNPTGLPIPAQNTLTFCTDMDLTVVDDVGRDLVKLTKISIVVIILVALVLVGLNCLLEWYMWRSQNQHFEYTRQAWSTDPSVYHSNNQAGTPQLSLTNHNLLILSSTSAHPLLTRFSNWISARLRLSPSKHNNLQWFFSYVFHPPALACFLIGFFGLLAIEIQLLAMGPLVDSYSDRVASTESDFTNTIALSINDSMYNQSAAYSLAVNTQVDGMQTTLNDGLFGWVNTTTVTLNETLVQFYDEIESAVSAVFNGTILEDAALEFLQCFIGSKVDALEDALTFLHDNLIIDLPRMNETALLLSSADVNEVSTPIAAATVGSGDDDDGGILGGLVQTYVKSLEKERITFGIFLGLWGVVVFMAICIILWHSYGKAWLEGRERRKWQREQRGGETGFVDPFRVGQPMYPPDSTVSFHDREQAPSSPRRGFAFPSFKRPRIPAYPESDSKKASWDGLFDEKSDTETRKRTISHPRRLMPFGNTDKERSEPELYEETEETGKPYPAWYTRFAALLGRRAQREETSSTESAVQENDETPRQRYRPNLRISVGKAIASRPKYVRAMEPVPSLPEPAPPAPEVHVTAPSIEQHEETTRSRWSASPIEPPNAPWSQRVLSWTTPALRPKVLDDVPSDVPSTYEAASSLGLAPPLHHGFDNRDPATPPGLNPFVTPFDDEHRVTISRGAMRKSMATNPFTGHGVAM